MGHSVVVWDDKAATEMTKDWNGIDQVVLKSPHGGLARISLHGRQVTSWRNEHGEELFFTSSKKQMLRITHTCLLTTSRKSLITSTRTTRERGFSISKPY